MVDCLCVDKSSREMAPLFKSNIAPQLQVPVFHSPRPIVPQFQSSTPHVHTTYYGTSRREAAAANEEQQRSTLLAANDDGLHLESRNADGWN